MRNNFISSIIVSTALFTGAAAQQYVPTAKGSKTELKFTYHKDDEAIKCSLGVIKGKINFDPKKLSAASFDITIGTSLLNTGITEWNKTVKSESFLNTAKYPAIHLKSTSVTQDKAGSIVYIIHGNLTIKGITKMVNIQFVATPLGTGYIFRGGFDVSRQGYDLGTKDDKLDDPVAMFIEIKADKR